MKNLDLSLLNAEQLSAVEKTDGAILVSAGAGTGKTRLLTYRVAYLINNKGVLPQNILAITFTNKATNEMRERIISLCDNGSQVTISTFHSLCSKILRKHINLLGNYNRYFTILDDSDKQKIIKKMVKEANPNTDAEFEKKLLHYISVAKNENIKPDEFVNKFPYLTYTKDIAKFYELYETILKNSNSLDFDDLLIKTLDLFDSHPEVLKLYQNQFKYILVDEFQDTNSVQYSLIKLLADIHKNILVVGDEDQSIYGFRGANYQNLNSFKRDFDNVTVIKLEQNYRSTKQILDKANLLINKNIERSESKNLYTENVGGEEIIYNVLDNDYKEADYVAIEIGKLIRRGISPNDIAIIYRVNSLSRQFEKSLVNNGIGYRIYGGFKFYERAEIKNVLAYLRLLVNPRDNEAFLRVCNFPKRGIGDSTIKKLEIIANESGISLLDACLSGKINHAGICIFSEFYNKLVFNTKNKILPEIISQLISDLDLKNVYNNNDEEDQTRLLNIKGLKSAVNEFYQANPEANLSDFLENVNLDAIKNDDDENSVVTLSTIHGVKGLEFDVVFLVGCEEGMLPFKRSIDEGEIEEERRLCYVAITRAKKKLYITRARERYFSFGGGYSSSTTKSRFIKEMEISSSADNETTFLFDNEFNNRSFNGYSKIYNRAYQNYKVNETGNNSYNSNYTTKKSVKVTPDILENMVGLKRASELVSEKQSGSNKNLSVGTKVSHVRFGNGVITSVNEVKPENVIIRFENGQEKELNLNFAPIEVIK